MVYFHPKPVISPSPFLSDLGKGRGLNVRAQTFLTISSAIFNIKNFTQ